MKQPRLVFKNGQRLKVAARCLPSTDEAHTNPSNVWRLRERQGRFPSMGCPVGNRGWDPQHFHTTIGQPMPKEAARATQAAAKRAGWVQTSLFGFSITLAT